MAERTAAAVRRYPSSTPSMVSTTTAAADNAVAIVNMPIVVAQLSPCQRKTRVATMNSRNTAQLAIAHYPQPRARPEAPRRAEP
jgi:hypothetical protein